MLAGLRPRHVLADAAYDSDAIRAGVRPTGTRPCIKPNPTRMRKKRYDRQRYQCRSVDERSFGRVRQCRRVATRNEKKADDYAGFAWLAAFVTRCV